MATIVERPLSAFSMSASPTVVPQRRRRDSVEVIDVDSFEETNTRPSQRRRVEQDTDIIELLDSDEEPGVDTHAAGSSGGSGMSFPARCRRSVHSGVRFRCQWLLEMQGRPRNSLYVVERMSIGIRCRSYLFFSTEVVLWTRIGCLIIIFLSHRNTDPSHRASPWIASLVRSSQWVWTCCRIKWVLIFFCFRLHFISVWHIWSAGIWSARV
jgi:hypothetical protein